MSFPNCKKTRLKAKKRPDMRFSKKPSVHQATQKSHLAKASLTWKEPDKWVIFFALKEKRLSFCCWWTTLFTPFGSWTHFTVCLPRQVLISLHNFYDWAIFGRCCNILALQYTTLPWLAARLLPLSCIMLLLTIYFVLKKTRSFTNKMHKGRIK